MLMPCDAGEYLAPQRASARTPQLTLRRASGRPAVQRRTTVHTLPPGHRLPARRDHLAATHARFPDVTDHSQAVEPWTAPGADTCQTKRPGQGGMGGSRKRTLGDVGPPERCCYRRPTARLGSLRHFAVWRSSSRAPVQPPSRALATHSQLEPTRPPSLDQRYLHRSKHVRF